MFTYINKYTYLRVHIWVLDSFDSVRTRF